MAATGSLARSRRRLFTAVTVVAVLASLGAWRWDVTRRTRIYERSFLAMGTFIHLRAAGPLAPRALASAVEEIERLDALFSYEGAGSDVRRLNEAAGRGPVAVSPETVELLELALYYAEASGGRFDPTVGPLVDVWGFRPDSEPAVPGAQALEDALAKVGYRDLRVDRAAGSAELLRPGMAVDLGGIAKGYALDRVVETLRAGGVTSAILDVGGNIYALGLRPDGQQWRVGFRHPRDEGGMLGALPMTDASVATSGDYQRYFEVGGQRYHHLFDPLTGYPATGILAISIVARSGAEGDAVSTAAFVLGPEAAPEFVRGMSLEAVTYTAQGRLEVTPGLQGSFEVKIP